ncbi:MAG: FHA domain-containing protein, partial [Planctomycetaceae bacterium]|nr:FHA domain-containing protein [Planctomycetaceae bacterium]
MQTAELTIQTPNGEKVVPLVEGQPLFVGRTSECDLYLPSPAVSRRHAVFLTRHGHVGLKDLDSANGTYLNGRKITKPIRLKDGDIIQVATFVMHFAKKADENGKTVILSSSILDDHAAARQAADISVAEKQSQPPAAPDRPDREAAEPSFADDASLADDETGSGEFFANIPDAPAPAPAEPPPSAAEAAEQAEPAATRSHLDGRGRQGESDTRVIARPPRPRPTRPHTIAREIDEDVVGDGDGDHLMMDDAPAEEAGDGELALTKAAAEAGLVGEFVPEEEAARPNGGGGLPDLSGAAVDTPKPYTPAENAIPIDEKFREAIEARLALFSFLADLKQERDELLAANPGAPDAVKSEFSRQDREMDKLPTADQCDSMIEKRTARRRDLKEKIKEAKKNGTKPPPRPSKLMIEAEDMAINQWTILSQSYREVLPTVFAQGYRLTGQEPLAQAMEEAGLDGKVLLGGGAYLLALGELLEETKYNRAYVKSRLAEVDSEEKKSGGGKRFSLFGGKNDDDEEDEDESADDTPTESPEELRETEKYLGQRVNWINQESTYIEQMLIKEFWDVYTKLALHYLPNHEEMTVAVRAFLRHGVIGFMPWWLKPEVREHVMTDCGKDVVHHMVVSRKNTNILYADEYLAAVMNMECTPAKAETLEINEK